MTRLLALGILGLVAATAHAQWTVLAPKSAPQGRTVACFTNIKGGGALLFGGSAGAMLADTWLWQDGDWHNVSGLGKGATPPGRALGAMAAHKDGVVMFGGYESVTASSNNDTWVWDPTTGWTELTHQLSVAPPARSYHTMAAIEGGVYLFGGTARTDEAHDTAIGDSWLFSDTESTWTQLDLAPPQAPPARWGHSMACSPPAWLEQNVSGETSCTLFGGAALSEDDHFDDTWVFHPMQANDGKLGWQKSQPAVADPPPKPAGRWSFQIASCGAGTLMAGGSIGYRICADDTWTFNATVFPSVWTSNGTSANCESALKSACPTTGGKACTACAAAVYKKIFAAGCVWSDATAYCEGKTNKGINHDAIGEWKRAQDAATGDHPGYLGGAMMARVTDSSLGKGVLHFGGTSFSPTSNHIGPADNVTRFWPASSCP